MEENRGAWREGKRRGRDRGEWRWEGRGLERGEGKGEGQGRVEMGGEGLGERGGEGGGTGESGDGRGMGLERREGEREGIGENGGGGAWREGRGRWREKGKGWGAMYIRMYVCTFSSMSSCLVLYVFFPLHQGLRGAKSNCIELLSAFTSTRLPLLDSKVKPCWFSRSTVHC